MSRIFTCFLCIILFFFVFTNLAFAQGSVAGIVVNAAVNEYLPGANVFLEGTNLGTSTDREGFFKINNVPPGNYKLVVSYIGFKEYRTDVTVSSSDARVVLDEIGLEAEAVEADAIVVEGLREGQMKALNQQRVAPNIKNVVSREQMERFPDQNVAEVVKRLPGIYISRTNGEGRYVHIRGTDPRLSTVMVNGEKLPSTRQEERYASLDIIGSNQAAAIEVVKALTPDMEGDAIGGSVNLISRSAFDYEGQKINLTLGSGYGDLLGNAQYQVQGSYSNRFGAKRNIGLTISANFNRSDRGAEGMEYDWDEAEDVNDNVIPFALVDFDLRDYYVIRDNIGFGGSFEYRADQSNRFFVRGTWNQFNDDTHRGRWRIRTGSGNFLNPEGTLTERSRLEIESQDRTEENNMSQYSLGGVHQFDKLAVDYTVAYSTSFEKTEPSIETNFRYDGRVGMQLSGLGSDEIMWQLTNTPNENQYDAALYKLREFDVRNRVSNNSDLVASVNFKLPYNLGELPSELKFGLKGHMGKKDRNDDRYQYSWEGDDDVFLNQFDPVKPKKNFLDDYTYAPLGTEKKYESFYNKYKGDLLEGELDVWDSEGQTFEATEDIYAAYAMTTVNMGNFLFLAGLRNEYTAVDYTGTELFYDSNGDFESKAPVSKTNSFNHILPNLHVRYRFTPMSNLRLAFTRALSRPNYWDLAPRFSFNPDDEEIISGNVNLVPTTAFNIDLMGEHYFQGIGIASGGLFYKKLDDIIFTVTRDISGGVYDGFEEEKPINGGSADLLGIELNWNQQLTFLPGVLDGLGIYANYTHVWAKSDLSDAEKFIGLAPGEKYLHRDDFLPGQSGDVLNFAISYEKFGFSGRLSMTYQGEYVEEVGKNNDYDEWRDDHLQIDFSATQDIWSGLKAYLELINLTNEPQRNYIGVTERPRQREYYSWWMRAGLKLSL